ncbi:Proteasome (Prosome_ macropain) 26S subunit_ nonATPase_ 12 [Caligus rogercresseyi]|uniref:Proteasome (Prosome_ macropain) 26S subunit_ nonATPase_ 12 n=1 Tax=Caligus rogercresseyi TaxID=217165 RepID=A0A7T8JXB4_CALRO|nr:Proteasome (Prosome_ macropain) 26S subunit_ nonATPase_ 12 [Caligus rogercresseyi]
MMRNNDRTSVEVEERSDPPLRLHSPSALSDIIIMSPTNSNSKMDVDVESKINEIIVEGSGLLGPKMEVDYAETVNEKIPEAEALDEIPGISQKGPGGSI